MITRWQLLISTVALAISLPVIARQPSTVLGAENKNQRYITARRLIERHFDDIEYNLEQERQEIQRTKYWTRFLSWLKTL